MESATMEAAKTAAAHRAATHRASVEATHASPAPEATDRVAMESAANRHGT